ncbi:MAG: ABC transporter permease [Clostridia bacterium]|nr:ABC transporter permease [Clostridia bacterium]
MSYFKLLAQNLKEHKENYVQVLRLSIADLKKTYHGAALGWFWAVVKPVVSIFVYWFAIEVGLRKGGDVEGFPFVLWLIAGMVPWFYMTELITGGTDCIRKYSYLVTKMKYPIMTIPTFTNLSKLIVNLVLIIVVIALFWVCGYPPSIYLLQLPVYIFMMFMFFNAWGLFAGLVSAIGKDFSNLVKSFVTAVFWLSGVLWNIENVANIKFFKIFFLFNPVTYFCYGFRNCFIYKKWFFEEPVELCCFLGMYVVLAFLSLWAYKKLRKEIPDVL